MTHGHIFLYNNYTTVVLSVIVTPHISKTHLPIISLNVRENQINLQSGKKKDPSYLRCGSPTPPPAKPSDLLDEAPTPHRGMRLPNMVQSK